jgi:hypothetical protein
MLSFFAIDSPDELRYVQTALRGGIDKIFENSADGKWQFSSGQANAGEACAGHPSVG